MTDSRIVLLPVYRCTLHAIIDRGMRWSEVEHLILYALSQKDFTTIELSQYAGLPRSVVVEAVVRLMRIDWVEMFVTSQRISFQISSRGLIVVAQEKLPSIPNRRSRVLSFFIEQLGGNILSFKGIVPLRDEEAKEFKKSQPDVREITPQIRHSDLPIKIDLIEDLSQNQDIVYGDEEIVGYNPDLTSLDDDWYAKLEVTEGEVKGLPSTCSPQLQGLIYDYFKANSSVNKSNSAPQNENTEATPSCPIRDIDLHKEDFIIGGSAHKSFLESVLENAQSHVIIYSTFIRSDALFGLVELFVNAANRGVKIDLLWDSDPCNQKAEEATENFCGIIKKRGLSDWVRLRDFPVGSHSKLMLYDDGVGSYHAIIGSCNWLYTNFSPMEISVRLRSSGVVLDCVKIFESLIPSGNRGNGLREHFFNMASSLKKHYPQTTGNAKGRIISIGDHEDIIHRACDNAQSSIFIASNRLGNAVENQVLAPLYDVAKKGNVGATVCYQRTNEESAITEEVMETLKKRYGKYINIQAVKKAHAKILCWDSDHVVITSLNWLSKDDYGRSPYGEVGIYLNGPGLADYVKECYLKFQG